MYDIKGVPTSAGSRAYGELYGPSNTSASSLLRLEKLGGIFVGKTKTGALVEFALMDADSRRFALGDVSVVTAELHADTHGQESYFMD